MFKKQDIMLMTRQVCNLKIYKRFNDLGKDITFGMTYVSQ